MEKTEIKTEVKNREVRRTTLTGTVVSDKMKDTAVVLVERFEKHPKYQKYLKLRKRFKVHDPGNTVHIGDKVTIEACRPISKDKHFQLKK